MVAKLITIIILALMSIVSINPLNLGVFYLLFRPMVQPHANALYTIFLEYHSPLCIQSF